MLNSLNMTLALIRRKYPDFEYSVFHDTPITALNKTLHECKLALVTTGGLHLKTDTPFDTKVKGGDCSYRMLPNDVTHKDIMVTHESYNHKFINEDLNCVFPIDRMREFVSEGRIRSLSKEHYSFMGHISDPSPLHENAVKVGYRLKELGVDIAFLTPT
jgi:D-proline reductase (dithiol) PrdB